MNYSKFILYNITGGIAWVAIFVYGGFYFGNLPWVKNNFSVIILAIIVISVLPLVIQRPCASLQKNEPSELSPSEDNHA